MPYPEVNLSICEIISHSNILQDLNKSWLKFIWHFMCLVNVSGILLVHLLNLNGRQVYSLMENPYLSYGNETIIWIQVNQCCHLGLWLLQTFFPLVYFQRDLKSPVFCTVRRIIPSNLGP